MSTFNKQFLVRTGVNLPVGTTTSAPLTFQQGINLTNLATGSVEWDGYNLYVTETSTHGTSYNSPASVTRRTIAYVDSTLLSQTSPSLIANGLTQGTAPVITTDHAFITDVNDELAEYNGVALPPAIPGRMVRVVNAGPKSVKIYPLSTTNITGVTFSAASNVISVDSTEKLYPGMAVVLTAGDGGGVIQAGSKIVSILSTSTFSIDTYTSGQITANGTLTAGTVTKINASASNVPYLMSSSSGVEFIADTNASWYTVALSSSLGSGNTTPLGGTFAPGDLVYAISGNYFEGLDAEIIGKALITNGVNAAPVYGKIQLDQTLTTTDTNKSHVQGVLPVLNGGTGTAGTALQAAATSNLTYDIVTASNVTGVNIGTNADTIYIGKTDTSNTTVNNDLTVMGDLTVNGTTTTVNSTITTLDDPILTLGGDTAPTTDDNKDRGVEFKWHTGSNAKVGFFGWDDSEQEFVFLSDSINTSETFAATGISTNYLSISPSATGQNVSLDVKGSDTDISFDITTKGAGDINLNADTIRVGDLSSAAVITSNGAGSLTVTTGGSANLVLHTNDGIDSGSITISNGLNGNIVIEPNGTGDVFVNADTLRVGDSGSSAYISSNGTGDLILNTNTGANSGSITIGQGTNGNITLAPDGTGDVYLNADLIRVGDTASSTIIATDGAGPLTVTTGGVASLTLSTNNSANSGSIVINQGTNGNIEVAPNGTGDIYLTSDTVRVGDLDSLAYVTTNGIGDLVLNTNNGTNSGSITLAQGTNGNITLEPNGTGDIYLNADTIRVGDAGAEVVITSSGAGDLTITTGGAGDLTLNTNGGINSGFIAIPTGVDANITIETNGAGDVLINTDTVRVGDTGVVAYITSNNSELNITTGGTNNLILSTNSNTNSGTITINDGVNGDIVITTNGNGDVLVNADTLRVGDQNIDSKITSWGTGDLTLTTNSGVNSGSITIQDGTTGDILISPATNGLTKLSVSPPQTAISTEVVTAEWVINRTTAIDTVSVHLTTTTLNQVVDPGFSWSTHRSAKYIIQVTQVGANATRSQSSEILVTHDAPFYYNTNASSSSTTVLVESTAGLYEGMTVEVVSGTGEFQANTVITDITTNASFVVSLAPTTALSSATIKAYLSGNYISTASATGTGTLITVDSTSKMYPGMSISVTSGSGAFPTNTYVASVSDDTTFIASQAPTTPLNNAVITGAPNVYITEYAVVETNGTACSLTATVDISNVVLIASPLSWSAGLGTTINIGTISETLFKGERQLIELR